MLPATTFNCKSNFSHPTPNSSLILSTIIMCITIMDRRRRKAISAHYLSNIDNTTGPAGDLASGGLKPPVNQFMLHR